MITLLEILSLVADHEAQTGETMTELSRRSTKSNDTIRNWRRRLNAGEEPSASFQNVQSVLEAMGYHLILGIDHPIRTGPEILETLQKIEGLDRRGVELAFAVINNQLDASRDTRSSPADADDQSSMPSPRHVGSASR